MSQTEKGVLVFNEWLEAMEKLCARDYKMLMSAMYKYQIFDEEPPIFQGKVEILARVIFPCLERRKKMARGGKKGTRIQAAERSRSNSIVAEGVKEGVKEVAEDTSKAKENNSKEKNSTVKSSEFIGQADLISGADADDEVIAKYAPYHIKRARGKHENVFLSDVEYDELKHLIFNADAYIDQFSEKLHDKGYRFADHYGTLRDWWERDKKLPQYNVSQGFTSSAAERERPRERGAEDEHWDEFFEAAVKRSLGGGAFCEKACKKESE